MIYLIYHPPERHIAERIAEEIERVNGINCGFAPLGLQALTDEWNTQVEQDILASQAVILLMTDSAVRDESVLWRFQKAVDLRKRVIPVAWENPRFPEKPDDKRLELMNYFNFIFVSTDDTDRAITRIAEYFTFERIPLCFVSYSRSDSEFAAKLTAGLREANVKTWRDAENLPSGANWDREIEKAINTCSHVLLIATPRSVESENVMDEISLALNKGKTVIPLILETCDLPMRVHRAQWIDFRDGFEQGFDKLLEQLKAKRTN